MTIASTIIAFPGAVQPPQSLSGKIALCGVIHPQVRPDQRAPHRLVLAGGLAVECHARRTPDDLRERAMNAICIGEYSRAGQGAAGEPKFIADLVVAGAGEKTVRGLLDLYDFLTGILESGAKAFDVIEEFGAEAREIVEGNPWRIVEVDGVGLKTADKAAKAVRGVENFDRMCVERLSAALTLAVRDQSMSTGSTIVSHAAAINLAMGLNFLDLPQTGELRMRLDAMFPALVSAEKLVPHTRGATGHVGLARFLNSEKTVAKIVKEKLNRDARQGDLPPAPDAFVTGDLTLAPSQDRAMRALIDAPVGVLTGGPGTGKTSTVRCYCDTLAAAGLLIALCAPTGRAAQRLAQSTGREASTIHRLFQVGPNGKARVNAANPLACDALVVDESTTGGPNPLVLKN